MIFTDDADVLICFMYPTFIYKVKKYLPDIIFVSLSSVPFAIFESTIFFINSLTFTPLKI